MEKRKCLNGYQGRGSLKAGRWPIRLGQLPKPLLVQAVCPLTAQHPNSPYLPASPSLVGPYLLLPNSSQKHQPPSDEVPVKLEFCRPKTSLNLSHKSHFRAAHQSQLKFPKWLVGFWHPVKTNQKGLEKDRPHWSSRPRRVGLCHSCHWASRRRGSHAMLRVRRLSGELCLEAKISRSSAFCWASLVVETTRGTYFQNQFSFCRRPGKPGAVRMWFASRFPSAECGLPQESPETRQAKAAWPAWTVARLGEELRPAVPEPQQRLWLAGAGLGRVWHVFWEPPVGFQGTPTGSWRGLRESRLPGKGGGG